MECPTCRADVDPGDMTIEPHEEGVEVRFICPGCCGEFFCILTSWTFLPVE